MRLVALLSGSDWFDAGVEHLVVPPGCDLDGAYKAWGKWYKETYCPSLGYGRNREQYFSFPEWLIKHHGARETTDAELEIYDLNAG